MNDIFCSYHISFAKYYGTDAQQHGICTVLVLYDKVTKKNVREVILTPDLQ